jgi:hypothetical protein
MWLYHTPFDLCGKNGFKPPSKNCSLKPYEYRYRQKQHITLTSYIKKSYAAKNQIIQDKSKALRVLTSLRDDIRDTTIPYYFRGLLFRC